jgi:hypothetical protein
MRKYSVSSIINLEKKEELIFTKLLAFCSLMKEFDFTKEKINDISKHIFDKYKISQASREQTYVILNKNI